MISGISERTASSIRCSISDFFSGGSLTQPGPPPTITPEIGVEVQSRRQRLAAAVEPHPMRLVLAKPAFSQDRVELVIRYLCLRAELQNQKRLHDQFPNTTYSSGLSLHNSGKSRLKVPPSEVGVGFDFGLAARVGDRAFFG